MTLDSLLVHLPHASTRFPFLDGYLRPDLLAGEVCLLTDWHTERLFAVPGVEAVRAGFSRVFCDVERFVPDELEPMAAQGMGFYYTHTDDGVPLRDAGPWKERVLREFYEPHHARLTAAVASRLDATGVCCLLDAHSFSAVPFRRELDQRPDRPDVCLGTQGLHTPPWLWSAAAAVFVEAGLTVAFDRPYEGSLVPLAYLGREPRVLSLMVELNRRLYLDKHEEIPGAVERLRAVIVTLADRLLQAAPA